MIGKPVILPDKSEPMVTTKMIQACTQSFDRLDADRRMEMMLTYGFNIKINLQDEARLDQDWDSVATIAHLPDFAIVAWRDILKSKNTELRLLAIEERDLNPELSFSGYKGDHPITSWLEQAIGTTKSILNFRDNYKDPTKMAEVQNLVHETFVLFVAGAKQDVRHDMVRYMLYRLERIAYLVMKNGRSPM